MPEHICRPGGVFGWRYFLWIRELAKFCVELAAVALYGLRCQFSHAQPLPGGRQMLCWADPWVTSEGSPNCQKAVHLLCRSGVLMQAINVQNNASDRGGSASMWKDYVCRKQFFKLSCIFPFFPLTQYRKWEKRTKSSLLMLSSACGWKTGPSFSFHSRFEKSVSRAIKSDWILEFYLNFT